ncbi:MAG TPA: D-glycerate dehydrogenase [Solirubrobacteraceae bacterium]|jgi:glyoxylate reductase|nr:D-glycerate dehydrogenase [Solirubrobacteraceae bacterium]
MRCFVTRRVPGDALDRLAAFCEVDVWPGELPPSPEDLRRAVADVDGLLCTLTDRIDAALFAAAPRLRFIATFSVGYDNVDLAAASSRGIGVGNTPDVLTDATADLTMALLLALARHVPEAQRDARAARWRTWEPAGWLGLELAGQRMAVVGPGRIGRAVARRAHGFGVDVAMVGRVDDLHAALGEAAIVSLHAPLSPATHHLIDVTALAAMRPGALLINTARGGLVDQAALLEALESGHLGGAGLDVTDPEPLPADHPLMDRDDVIVLPHIGSATHATRARMADMAVENLIAGLSGAAVPWPVRPPGTGATGT